jgi:histidine triad (HIT) family protein
MSSIFTKIISGEIPCYKVAESRDFFAFLDIRPVAFGHTLVVPKLEIDYIFDMEDEHLSAMFLFAKKVAWMLKAEIECERIGVSVIGLEVPHTHIHLIPLKTMQDMNFMKDRYNFQPEEYAKLSGRLEQSFKLFYPQ